MDKSWKEKWIEDIDYLKNSLIAKHKNLFFSISRKEFEKKISELKSMVNQLDYDEMKVELSRIVASVRDAHTAIAFPIERYIPLEFYCFGADIYIINTSKGYENLLYKKVTQIEDSKIEQVMEALSQIISYENKYFFKAQCVKYLQAADVLYGLLICDDKNKIKIMVENKIIEVETVALNQLNYIENINVPLYAENPNENYWFKYIEKFDLLYIKYNKCREEEIPLKDKIKSTINFIEENNITKITIDLRNNLGGDSMLLESLIEYIRNNKDKIKKGNLNVIIGRETFSSGVLNAYELKTACNAILMGEPSGGKPNCFGEILRFNLPNSKFNVSYSTRYYKLIEDDNIDALYPDEIIEENIDDFRKLLIEVNTVNEKD